MQIIKKYITDLFIPVRFYLAMALAIFLFIISFFIPAFYELSKIILSSFVLLILVDYIFLFFIGKAPKVKRLLSERLSNSDKNIVELQVTNRMEYEILMYIIDELPEQFQQRDFGITKQFKARQELNIKYSVTPVERGVYNFGNTQLYIRSRLGLVTRRFTAQTTRDVSVYPSFMQLKKYELISQTSILHEHGSKRMRKIGQSMEFEQIKEYVTGDDVRTVNWKATARKGFLMINNFADEKSQQVYCIIDKGRLMKMPFAGLTLLDYAINSTLVLSNVCLQRQDKIGLITFAGKKWVQCLLLIESRSNGKI